MAVNVVYQDKGHPYNKETPIRTFYEGLSVIGGDIKPTDCNKGSEYRELDTMDLYGFDGASWLIKELGVLSLQSPIFDNAGRISNNSVFGERLVGTRKPSIASQFQYGFNSYETSTVLTNGGTVSTANSMAVTSTGTNIAGTAVSQTKKALRYIPGHEAYLFGTSVFSTPKSNSYQRAGLFDDQNGFFIGYEGTVFGVTRRRTGTSVFVPQSNFNIDRLDGSGRSGFTIDPTKGNVYSIKFGYLGFANIYFEVLSTNGEWITFHRINYPNTSTITHIANSMLPIRSEVGNTGNNTDIRISTGSVSAGIVDGAGTDPSTRSFSSQGLSTTVSATTGVFVAFKNKATFNSISNYVPALLDLISVAVDGNKNMTLQLWKNPTLTNSPTWADVDSNSVLQRATNATITPGTGQLLLSVNIQKIGDFFQYVTNLDFLLYAGEHVAFTWVTSTGVTSQVDLGIRWSELF